jgi:hypothetical protein
MPSDSRLIDSLLPVPSLPSTFPSAPHLVVCHLGTWKGDPVAVKIVTHSASEEGRITRELRLAQQLDHPHLVRALHHARMNLRHSADNTPVRYGSTVPLALL